MQQKGFIPWIFSEDKKPFFEGSNNIVQEADATTLLKPDGQPAHLPEAPDGWAETLIKWGTSLTYLGLMREFTVPMKFVKSGAKILRYIFWTKGMEAIAYYALHKLNRLVYPILYENWFIGELDFTEFKQAPDSVTINVMEGGASKMLKAFENSTYEIPINTDPDKKIIYLDGLPFTNKIEWKVYDGQVMTSQHKTFAMGVVSTEGTTQGVLTQDVMEDLTPGYPNDFYFLWTVDKVITAKVRVNIAVLCTSTIGSDASLNVIIHKYNDHDTSNTPILVFQSPSDIQAGATFYIDETVNIPLLPTERIDIERFVFPATSGGEFEVKSGIITVEYDVTFTPSYCECLTPYTVAQRLWAKMCNGKYGFQSTFLQELDDILLTGGTALRKYQSDSSVKTSLADFFQAMRTRGRKKYSIGLAIINDKLVIEELDYFFRSDIIMDLGLVTGLNVSVANDMNFNTIKVGYKNQEVDKVNGRDGFNVTQLYSTPNTRKPKELDLTCPYATDMYYIEVTRIDLYGKDTTDNKADNETFMLSAIKQDLTEVVYYDDPFTLEVNSGQFYINIPEVISNITNGLKVRIAGTASNDGIYTIENTSYLVAGHTIIRVSESVTPESVTTGIIYTQNVGIYILNRPAFTSVTGLLHPDKSFNILLSPKRNLFNCGGVLHPFFDKLDYKEFVFETGEKNSELSTLINGETITENANITIGTLQDKLFLPYYLKFTCIVPDDALLILNTNPYGRIKFTDDKTGLVLYGRMWDGGVKPEPNDKQEWTLIASPNQDLSRFI